jgi:hypothetical protein
MNSEKDNIQKDNSGQPYMYDPLVFHADYSVYLLYKRIDNITAALYLVTNTLPESETMKSSLRLVSLKCLHGIGSFIGKASADISSLHTLVAHILELSSLLNVSMWSGVLSEMNASVLQKEVSKINDTVVEIISKYRSNVMLNSNFFAGIDLEQRQYKNSVLNTIKDTKPDLYKGHDKRHIKDTKLQSQPATTSLNINDSESRMKRREIILQLLSERSNLSIKDFSAVIQSYSEKTIQRELLAMVEEGLLKKQGERRWSTYSRQT